MEITEIVDEEERIAALEKRVRNMDALVRGLVAELLDLKTVVAASAKSGEPGSRMPGQETVVAAPSTPDGTTVIRPKAELRQDDPAAPVETAMVRIMQSDGTMKLEPRFGNKKTM